MLYGQACHQSIPAIKGVYLYNVISFTQTQHKNTHLSLFVGKKEKKEENQSEITPLNNRIVPKEDIRKEKENDPFLFPITYVRMELRTELRCQYLHWKEQHGSPVLGGENIDGRAED